MRLDLLLKASRIEQRRTIGQKLCDGGLVCLNETPAKSAHEVKVGDEISIKRGDKISKLKVLDVPSARQTSRKNAGMLYEILSEEQLHNDFDR